MFTPSRSSYRLTHDAYGRVGIVVEGAGTARPRCHGLIPRMMLCDARVSCLLGNKFLARLLALSTCVRLIAKYLPYLATNRGYVSY